MLTWLIQLWGMYFKHPDNDYKILNIQEAKKLDLEQKFNRGHFIL